jgi:hypothetical protein
VTFVNSASLPNTFGFKNRIINGAMVIDQRNAGASVTPVNGQYSLDRWQMGAQTSSTYSVQQSSTAPTGFSKSLLVTSLAATSIVAGSFYSVLQIVEGFNSSDLGFGTANAKTITISFWVRSSLTGTFGGWVQNANVDRSYPFSYTISVANTWEQKTVTIAGDTTGTWVGATNGAGMYVGLSLGMGSTRQGTANSWQAGNYRSVTGETAVVGTNGATFYVTGFQLEVGTVATSFDTRSYGTELALCQRYFEKDASQGTAPQQGLGGTGQAYGGGLTAYGTTSARTPRIRFAVVKRASATMTFFRSAVGEGGTVDGQWNAYVSGVWRTATATVLSDGVAFDNEFAVDLAYTSYVTGSSYIWGGTWTASAEL